MARPSDYVAINEDGAEHRLLHQKSEEEQSSKLGQILFNWVTPMVDTGFSRTLELEDLPRLSLEDKAEVLVDDFKRAWDTEVQMSKTWEHQIGARLTDDDGRKGTLRWVGRLPYCPNPGTWYAGVEWDDKRRKEMVGSKNKITAIGGDGWYYGEKYFECKPGHGSFIRPHLVTLDSKAPTPKTPWVTWGIARCFWRETAIAGLYKIGNDATIFAGPIALKAIIDFLHKYKDKTQPDPPVRDGIWIVAILFACQLTQSLCVNQYFFHSARVGMKIRQALSAAIFDKALHLSLRTRAMTATGKIVNMMSTDAQRVQDVMNSIHTLWSAPLQIIVSCILLYRLVNVALFAGIGVMLLASPLQGRIMRKMMMVRMQMAKITDERIKAVTETLMGMRVIKFMNWDKRAETQLSDLRNREVERLATQQNYRVVMFSIVYMTPILLAATTFIVYAAMGYEVKPSVVFPSMSLFSILRFPFLILPLQFNTMVNAKISLDRLTQLFESPEYTEFATHPSPLRSDEKDCTIVVENGTFIAYEPQAIQEMPDELVQLSPESIAARADAAAAVAIPESEADKKKKKKKKTEERQKIVPKTVLKDVNLRLRRNKLTMIVGLTGSGKSVLLEALLGGVDSAQQTCVRCEGTVLEDGHFEPNPVAYSPQQAWIMNATLRENITFFEKEDEDWYHDVVTRCQLLQDLEQFDDGDNTEIGEKGVNLSGGQKQRVSIARAVYAKKDTTVLDDPLSAVDPHVGLELMKNVIGGCEATLPKDWPKAALQGRTRLLVTHQIQFLKYADDIVYIKNGKVANVFTGGDKTAFAQVLTYDGEGAEFFESLREGTTSDEPEVPPAEDAKSEAGPRALSPGLRKGDASREKGQLVKQEERAQGSVGMHMYASFVKAAGGWGWFAFVLFLFMMNQGAMQICDLWMTWWSDSNSDDKTDEPAQSLSNTQHIYIYASLIGSTFVINLLRGFSAYSRFQAASRTFHRLLVRSVLRAPLSFLDTTPIGRLVNRFSRDVDQVDVVLPPTVITFFQMIISVLAYLGIIAAGQQLMLALLVPAACVYYYILRRFIRSNRETKRLDSVNKSPLFQHFNETLSGTATILRFGKVGDFVGENRRRVDVNTRTTFANLACNRWLAIRLELLGNVVACATALFAVLSPVMGLGGSIGMLSLGITYSLALTNQLSFLVRQVADLEAQMNGVERIVEYSETIDQEPSLRYEGEEEYTSHFRGQQYLETGTNNLVYVTDVLDNNKSQGRVTIYSPLTDSMQEVESRNFEIPGYTSCAPKRGTWPQTGEIVLKNVLFRYRSGLPLVLKGLGGEGLRIAPRERIGVVGRTGAGKSTVMLALFRMVEIAGGSIEISGRDLRTLRLSDVRGALSMIPQDPMLFLGTIRSNLDPFGQSSDAEIWARLEQVNMKERIEAHDGQLDGAVVEGGHNFSVGQRQLLCMARALLKSNSRILLMDEATASIDHATDTAIQKTVREQFADYTVLTVAHRLQTIMDSTKIMVLDQGLCAEFDSPAALLSNPNSILYGMAKKAGNFDYLQRIATGKLNVYQAMAAIASPESPAE